MKSVDISIYRYLFPSIYEDGWKFISTSTLLALLLSMVWLPLALPATMLTVWCFYNFRDPMRITAVLSSIVVAPADGYVVSISKSKGPDALGLQNKNFTRICIYNSLFDAHNIRTPIKSRVVKTFYDAGKTFSGSRQYNCLGQERLLIHLRHNEGFDFVIRQAALMFNHQVCSQLKNGDEFLTGQRCGFIRFGGYIDIYLPEKISPLICVGQRMIAAETIIADIKSDAPRIEGEIR